MLKRLIALTIISGTVRLMSFLIAPWEQGNQPVQVDLYILGSVFVLAFIVLLCVSIAYWIEKA